MAPFGLKLGENAFQTIPNISFIDAENKISANVRQKLSMIRNKINRRFFKNYDKRPRQNYDWIGFWNAPKISYFDPEQQFVRSSRLGFGQADSGHVVPRGTGHLVPIFSKYDRVQMRFIKLFSNKPYLYASIF